jgi:hypothetical protein
MEVISEKIKSQYALHYIQVDYKHELKYLGKISLKQSSLLTNETNEILIYHTLWDIEKNRKATEIITKWK